MRWRFSAARANCLDGLQLFIQKPSPSKAGRLHHVALTDYGITLLQQHVAGKPREALVFTGWDRSTVGKSL